MIQAPPNTLLARTSDRTTDTWSSSDILTMQYGNNCYLRIPHEGGIITIYGTRQTITAKLQAALEAFDYNIAPQPEPPQAKQAAHPNPLHITNFRHIPLKNITPETMVNIFYNTPSLAAIAPDFESMICQLTGTNPDVITVQRKIETPLIDSRGNIVRGAQSRVAEALGIPNAGQSNRRRIDAVLTTLRNSTISTEAENDAKAA